MQQHHAMNNQQKKRACNRRILQIVYVTFTTLVFSVNNNMRRECHKFYSRLAKITSERKETFRSRFNLTGFGKCLLWEKRDQVTIIMD